MSTFLVYKVKKCLLKSGKVRNYTGKVMNDVHKCSPRLGHCLPTAWASCPHGLGIVCPVLGHILIKRFLLYKSKSWVRYIYCIIKYLQKWMLFYKTFRLYNPLVVFANYHIVHSTILWSCTWIMFGFTVFLLSFILFMAYKKWLQ